MDLENEKGMILVHQAEVQFCTVEQIESFVNAINHFDADFQFCSEERSVNAESIIGVFSMDFSKPLRLQYDSDDQRIEKVIGSYQLQRG